MQVVVILLLFVVIALVAALVIKIGNAGAGRDRLESVLNEKFIDFSKNIRETMDSTRREVEQSKDVLSKNAFKTLENINSMNLTIANLIKQQEKAQQLGQSLEYLLQTPKLRGNYGEVILEEMLERVLPKGIWEKQYAIEGSEKVDAVVKYKNIVIPIDAKFPKDDYQKYLAAVDPAVKRAHWANYEKALKIQIDSIKKKYIKPEKGTTEFALLFIPSEAIYYETIAEKNYLGDPCQIYEYASAQKVMPVSPNTFYAFLQVIILGIRNVEITQDVKKLQEMLTRVKNDFEKFYNNFEIIGDAIVKAQKAYEVGDGHIGRFKKNLDSAVNLELKTDDKPQIAGSDRSLLG